MVIKTCKICGKEFDARGSTVTCSPECSKKRANQKQSEWRENNRDKCRESSRRYYENNRDKERERRKKWHENNPEYNKEYYLNHRDEWREYAKEWRENNRDKARESSRKYYENNRDKCIKDVCIRRKNTISELCEQYPGDLEQILKNIPNATWHEREAKMRVWFGKSYYEGIMAKIESTPVCEVTGVKNDLVIHHLESFNLHPELGADPNNMVRVCDDIHKEFHSIYGYGNNTREQWNEFVENLDVKGGD